MPEMIPVGEEERSYSLDWKAAAEEKKRSFCFVPGRSLFIKPAAL